MKEENFKYIFLKFFVGPLFKPFAQIILIKQKILLLGDQEIEKL